MSSITNLKSAVSNTYKGYARPNRFIVEMDFPGDGTLNRRERMIALQRDSEFYVRAASIPSCTLSTAEYYYQGKTFKVPGDRQYEPWTCTFNLDTKMAYHNAVYDWINSNRGVEPGYNNTPASEDRFFYTKDLRVSLLDNRGDKTITYVLRYAYPTTIQSMQADFGANDAILEMTCQFDYQYYEIERRTD